MIKKVKVEDLQVGVYVHDFNCQWRSENLHIEQNFIRTAYTIEILKSWGIEEIYIDTEKGADVTTRTSPPANFPERVLDPADNPAKNRNKQPEIPLERELPEAKAVALKAVEFLAETNDQVAKGKQPDIEQTYLLVQRMQESLNRNRDALLLLTRIRDKDAYTHYHSISVSSLVLNLCQFLDLPEYHAIDLAIGALFHDIGKTVVDENILKKPGKLTADEYREIQRHAEYSVTLLEKTRGLPMECYDIALHHHERFDGSGYPKGLKGGQISNGSQMTCICDMFDAITSERCYKAGVDTVTGLSIVYEAAGSYFNETLVHDFIRCIGVYPVGTCVVLDDGRSGVVVSSTEDIMKPVVKVFFDEKSMKRIQPQQIDLSRTSGTIASYGDPGKFGLTATQLLQKLVGR